MQTKKYNIRKGFLNNAKKKYDYSKNFKPMPILYLELLENKSKIKQDLINKAYIPPLTNIDIPQSNTVKESFSKSPDKVKEKLNMDTINSKSERNESSKSSMHDDHSKSSRHEPGHGSKHESKPEPDSDSDSDVDVNRDSGSSSSESDSDELSSRLKNMLKEDKESDNNHKHRKRGNNERNHDHPPQKSNNYTNETTNRIPPTLAELEQTGVYNNKPELRNIDQITLDEKDTMDKKRELLFKFDLLKKSYPNELTLPEFTTHSDYNQMKDEYELQLKHLSLNSNVGTYKKFLIFGFIGTEFIFGKLLGFDMKGFTSAQTSKSSMQEYDRLLIELGEKNYTPGTNKYSVEVRLLFVILMNAAMFIVSKMVMRSSGFDPSNLVNNEKSFNEPKKKMRPPEIDPSQFE